MQSAQLQQTLRRRQLATDRSRSHQCRLSPVRLPVAKTWVMMLVTKLIAVRLKQDISTLLFYPQVCHHTHIQASELIQLWS